MTHRVKKGRGQRRNRRNVKNKAVRWRIAELAHLQKRLDYLQFALDQFDETLNRMEEQEKAP